MDRYQLAKLVQWAEECSPGGVKSRKRIQKVIFLLKCAGGPFDADYFLHHYGPYSPEVAQITDELVTAGLLVEEPARNSVGKQFNYKLNSGAFDSIAHFERTAAGAEAQSRIAQFEAPAKYLLGRDLNELEYAATAAFFHLQQPGWEAAARKMREFKRLPAESPAARAALELAERVVK
jgi:uncharacterized protein